MALPAASLVVLVTANTGGASASLTRLDRRLKGSAATGSAAGARIAKGMKVAALGVGAVGAASVYAAAKFETEFAKVRKTVDANEKGFARIEGGLRDLSKEIPVSANELANLAGEAGALGIKSKDIVEFTKTAATLGTTTELSSEDAANALARLSNIMDTKGKKSFERMASTLVDLGNKGASTEAEITEMALRLAKTGKQVGLSEADVLSFSSALASVGVRAEAGGSAFSRAFITMAEAVDAGGAELTGFAEVAGVSTGKFARMFEQDAAQAMATFTDGLGEIKGEGGSAFQVLDELGLSEVRVRDALLGAAGAGDLFNQTLKDGDDAWRKNDAAAKEAREAYKTFESQLTLLKNAVVDTGIGIGQDLLPDLKEMVKILSNPDLTLDEKVAQLGDRLGKMIGEWAPKVAEAGAKLGLSLAKGVGKAFLNSDLLGKLFIGAGLIRLFGGKGAILASGAAVGRFVGLGVASGAAAGAAGGAAGGAAAGAAGAAGIAGKLGGVLKNVKWARVGGLGAGLVIGNEILSGISDSANEGVDDLFTDIAARAEVTWAEELSDFKAPWDGGLGFGTDEGDQGERLLKTLEGIRDTGRQVSTVEIENLKREIQGLEGVSFAARSQLNALLAPSELANKMDRTAENIRGSYDNAFNLKSLKREHASDLATITANFGKGTAETKQLSRVANQALAAHVGDMIRDGKISLQKGERYLSKFGLSVKDLGPEFRVMNSKAREAFHGVGAAADRMKNEASRDIDAFSTKAINAFHRTAKAGERESGKMRDAVAGNYGDMSSAAVSALHTLGSETNKSLGALGAKKQAYEPKALSSKQITALKRQRGGSVIPGTGDGDKVPVMAEPGEGFLNKTFMKRIGGEKGLNALNSLVPRFQKGGAVEPPGDPGSQVVQSAYAGAVGNFLKKWGMDLTQGYNPGGPSVSPGHLSLGAAPSLDVVPLNGDWGGSFLSGLKWAIGQGWRVGYGSRGVGLSWPDHGEGNHAHIDWGGGGGQQLKKLTLVGPDGPLKDLGQASMDKAHKAATSYLASKTPTEGFEGGGLTGSGDVERMFAEVAKRLSSSKIATLALGMAGFAESGMKDLPGGHSTSQGALQLLASTASGLGIDPHDEKAVASHFLLRGYYGRGGANSLAAKGYPAHLVAQNVQGSAFGSGSNYLAQASNARGWMSRYNLQQGGIVEKLAAQIPPYAGSFAKGGTIPGPMGAPRLATVHGGERVSQGAPAVNVTVVARGSVEIEDVRAEIDGARAEIAEYTMREAGR